MVLKITKLQLVVIAVAIGLPVVSWLEATGGLRTYLLYDVPAGQVQYVLAKLGGLIAIGMLWAQFMLKLLSKMIPNQVTPPATSLHYSLGIGALVILTLHVALFIWAASLRSASPAFGLLIPSFSGDYYSRGVAFGAVGLWLFLLVAVSGVLRGISVDGVAKGLHRLSPLAFAFVLVHGYLIGSETGGGIMRFLYPVIALSFVASVYAWFSMDVRRKVGHANSESSATLSSPQAGTS